MPYYNWVKLHKKILKNKGREVFTAHSIKNTEEEIRNPIID